MITPITDAEIAELEEAFQRPFRGDHRVDLERCFARIRELESRLTLTEQLPRPAPDEPTPEIVDWRDEHGRGTWLANMLIMLVTTIDRQVVYYDHIKKRNTLRPELAGKMLVSCSIDGFPVSIRWVADRLADDFDRQVKRAAADLVRRKFAQIEEILSKTERAFRDQFPEIDWDHE